MDAETELHAAAAPGNRVERHRNPGGFVECAMHRFRSAVFEVMALFGTGVAELDRIEHGSPDSCGPGGQKQNSQPELRQDRSHILPLFQMDLEGYAQKSPP